MKKIAILSIMTSVLFVTNSCREEFLETAPTEFQSNPSTQIILNGLYLGMTTVNTGGTTSHTDFGQKGYDIYGDMLSSDMTLGASSYGQYRGLVQLNDTKDFTNTTNYQAWRYYYRIILVTNDIISKLGGNDVSSFATDEAKYGMGQAKAMRAHAYFNLMQYYNEKYDPSAESIPLYTEPTKIAGPKAKQSEVYALMVKDLTESITLLDGFARSKKMMINKYVAEGLLSYVYAAMGENEKIIPLAKDIIEKGGFPITTAAQAVWTNGAGGGFNDLATPSWMWGFDLTAADNGLNLISWFGSIDIYTYSYAFVGDAKAIDKGLYDSMQPDDIRRKQFEGSRNGVNLLPSNKFFAPARTLGGTRYVDADYIYMRVDEFHLLYAEALAKTGQDALAKTVLKNYLSTRIADVSYIDALSGTTLQNEIYKNTRIEFWGEGKSYYAMKRNKATITRGSNHLYLKGESFSYDDPRLTFRIPQAEIIDNPNF